MSASVNAKRSAVGWARYTPQIGGLITRGRISAAGMNISPCRATASSVAPTTRPMF